ncbi:MAG TPA: GntR family transcriptional regulator [Roseiarcus sp.]|jgi:DNA-binding GntR family transcriptional regulator
MIYGKLRAMLLDGLFAPGAKLKLRELAKEFGTSNTPVREALNRLAAEGSLETAQNRTVGVPIPTVAEVRESRRIRMELEGFAAAEAATRITAAEMEQVERFHQEYLQARQDGDAIRMQHANRAFHFTIYDAARMPMLREMIENFWLRNGPLQRLLHQRGPEPLRPSTRFHQEIVAALHERDAERARKAMRDDIAYPTDAIIVALAEIREGVTSNSLPISTGRSP